MHLLTCVHFFNSSKDVRCDESMLADRVYLLDAVHHSHNSCRSQRKMSGIYILAESRYEISNY